jgi:hypothetical protein
LSKSKFSGILDAAKGREDSPPSKRSKTSRQELIPVRIKRRGRPRGKRSDPYFEQTTAYIRKDTHREVKIALLQEGVGREYSELVEDLLSGWLKSRK